MPDEEIDHRFVPMPGCREMDGLITILSTRIYFRAVGQQCLHHGSIAILGSEMERCEPVGRIARNPNRTVHVGAMFEQQYDHAIVAGFAGGIECGTVIGLTWRMGIRAMGQQEFHDRGTPGFGGFVERGFSGLIGFIHIRAMRQQHLNDVRVTICSRKAERALAIGIAWVHGCAFFQEHADGHGFSGEGRGMQWSPAVTVSFIDICAVRVYRVPDRHGIIPADRLLQWRCNAGLTIEESRRYGARQWYEKKGNEKSSSFHEEGNTRSEKSAPQGIY